MNPYLLPHLGNGALRSGMVAAVPKFHLASATVIAHLAEFDARRLYVPEGYPSMARFCVGELGLTEQVALKLIRVGRTALQFPDIFLALADGRLNSTAVIMLAPWLTRENAAEVLAAAARKSNEEIRQLLAERFPKPDVPLRLETVAAPALSVQTVEQAVGCGGSVDEVSAQTPQTPAPRPTVAPLAPDRYGVRFTMGQATHEAMRLVEQLLGRRVTSDDMDEALGQGFKAMAAAIEKRKFAATDRPRSQRKASRGRHIPAEVKRAIRQRDQGRCTFVAESGRRCEARSHLEFDHVMPVARGGKATLDNLRLHCRAHNLYEAERAFGAGFMHEKRERARRAAAGRRVRTAAAGQVTEAAPKSAEHDVTPWLMRLGFRRAEALRAAAQCEGMPEASLEERVKAALSFLRPPVRGTRRVAIGPA
jgi:5-methylcytosine-specific restriction endonuclease McrA